MQLLGISLIGLNAQSARQIMLSLVFVAVVSLISAALRGLIGLVLQRTDHASVTTKFWTRHAVTLVASLVIVLGLLSIWFRDPNRLATAFGLFSAGVAFALQQVITSIAGYFVILRGRNFVVGDRITMGGVRGDVLRLGFIQTTIMEMGEPPSVDVKEGGAWVKSRQFTGRIVTVSNSKIFTEPVFNYTRDFSFIWEEMAIPITYKADRIRVEELMLEAAKLHAHNASAMAAKAKQHLHMHFGVEPLDLEPRVFYGITDNWLELTVRFLVETHRVRIAKDAISRRLMTEFDKAGIGIASSTSDIVGFPQFVVRSQ